MNATDILAALQRHHGNDAWAFFPEFRPETGFSGGCDDRRLDAWAMHLWPSRRHRRIAYEIKVSRADFRCELRNPDKRQPALRISNEFYFAAPLGLIHSSELPLECGLVTVRGDGWVDVVVRAPHRETAPPTWGMLAALARRLQAIEGRQPSWQIVQVAEI